MSATVLRLFVDRERICDGFLDMLAGRSEKQIMLLQSPGGMGKSWLVAKLMHECSRQSPGMPYAALDFKDGQAHDYLSIVRRARDDLGAANFNPLTQTINAATGLHVNLQLSSPGSGGVHVEGSSVQAGGDLAGRDIIKDNFFLVQVDSESVYKEIEGRITEAFFADLRSLLARGPAVFFFDTYEKAPEATRRWIEGNVLYHIREGKLPRAVVVITGREVPELDLAWKHCTARPKLEALDSEHVATYLREKRGLTDVDADTLYRATMGNPQLLGLLADNLAAASGDEEW